MAEQQVSEPDGYKMDEFRSPTPKTLKGASVVNANIAKQLLDKNDVAFIDVFPFPKRPAQLSDDVVWLPKKRMNIPGSIWLADVGFGVLSDELENYFKSNLNSLKQQGYQQLLFYCNVDCWMSWNAAKRALNYGFSNVYWFPGGVDEWATMGFELTSSEPLQINH